MATLQDRDKRSFVDSPTRADKFSREVVIANTEEVGAPGGSIMDGIAYDEVQITYPTSTTEVFTYKEATATVATVTVTYLAADKKDISSVVRT